MTSGSRFSDEARALRYALARALFKCRLAIARRRPVRQLLRDERRLPVAPVQLVSVAFENVDVVAAQVSLVRRWLRDPYELTIADNSPSRRARRAIRAICRSEGVGYLPLPRNPYTGRDASFSHGEALNYVCRHVRRLADAEIVGFLDHDAFPTRDVSLRRRLGGAPMYGRVMDTDDGWYLWPGLMFVKPAVVDLQALDFRPLWGFGDTGSRIFASTYKHFDLATIPQMSPGGRTLTTGDGSFEAEVYDEWVHLKSASGWRGDATPWGAICAALRDLPSEEREVRAGTAE